MLKNLEQAAQLLHDAGHIEQSVKLDNLILFLRDIPETISLDDVKQNDWLGELVLYGDQVSSATDWRAMDWLKSR